MPKNDTPVDVELLGADDANIESGRSLQLHGGIAPVVLRARLASQAVQGLVGVICPPTELNLQIEHTVFPCQLTLRYASKHPCCKCMSYLPRGAVVLLG